jgi:hypothetical protein
LRVLLGIEAVNDFVFSIDGVAGWVTLNRPRALNALPLNMARLLYGGRYASLIVRKKVQARTWRRFTQMADKVSRKVRSGMMAAVKGRDTRPGKLVRSILFREGFRFRLHRRDLPGNPDIVLPRYGTIVFVNGCFWHGHDCRGGRPSLCSIT